MCFNFFKLPKLHFISPFLHCIALHQMTLFLTYQNAVTLSCILLLMLTYGLILKFGDFYTTNENCKIWMFVSYSEWLLSARLSHCYKQTLTHAQTFGSGACWLQCSGYCDVGTPSTFDFPRFAIHAFGSLNCTEFKIRGRRRRLKRDLNFCI